MAPPIKSRSPAFYAAQREKLLNLAQKQVLENLVQQEIKKPGFFGKAVRTVKNKSPKLESLFNQKYRGSKPKLPPRPKTPAVPPRPKNYVNVNKPLPPVPNPPKLMPRPNSAALRMANSRGPQDIGGMGISKTLKPMLFPRPNMKGGSKDIGSMGISKKMKPLKRVTFK
jgi:hypothetical protein